MTVRIVRVYDAPITHDGALVMVDRLWPRGISKKEINAEHAQWLKDVAPSTQLRNGSVTTPPKFAEFERRYEAELGRPPAKEAYETLCELRDAGDLTLLYAAKDQTHNNAVVLQRLLTQGWQPDEG